MIISHCHIIYTLHNSLLYALKHMASCEPYCSSAYSEDLRWRRMVWLCDGLGYTYTRSAESYSRVSFSGW